MGCCRRVIHRYSSSKRGVFCLRWVLPLQIFVISSLGTHLLYKILYKPSAYSFIITLAHIFFALLILAECRRSIRYHNAIKELEALGDRRRALQ